MVMLVTLHWFEMGQSDLFIQLRFTSCVFFSVITSLLWVLMVDLMFAHAAIPYWGLAELEEQFLF